MFKSRKTSLPNARQKSGADNEISVDFLLTAITEEDEEIARLKKELEIERQKAESIREFVVSHGYKLPEDDENG